MSVRSLPIPSESEMALFRQTKSPAARRARLRVEELESRVVPSAPSLALTSLGNQGEPFSGFEDAAGAGESVSPAGDVNGDGYADVIVGAGGTDSGGTDRGAAYVVFGGPAGPGPITLNAMGTKGFTIRGFENS